MNILALSWVNGEGRDRKGIWCRNFAKLNGTPEVSLWKPPRNDQLSCNIPHHFSIIMILSVCRCKHKLEVYRLKVYKEVSALRVLAWFSLGLQPLRDGLNPLCSAVTLLSAG